MTSFRIPVVVFYRAYADKHGVGQKIGLLYPTFDIDDLDGNPSNEL